ncbi:MAG: hypothetical protein COB16_02710 [Rhodobacteraceae bacterium]|nr:MAG: hypothetical protein COB16_02710 [Paracoccaceae bacterium]
MIVADAPEPGNINAICEVYLGGVVVRYVKIGIQITTHQATKNVEYRPQRQKKLRGLRGRNWELG